MNKHIQSTVVITGLATVVIVAAIILLVVRGNNSNNNGAVPAPNVPNQAQVTTSSTATNGGNSGVAVAVPSNLVEGQIVSLPLIVSGMVPGNWFFEGSFPVVLKDTNGTQIAVALAQTTSNWMTTDMIPFTVTLPLVNYHGSGSVVFIKDNPTGESQFDASVTVNVVFN